MSIGPGVWTAADYIRTETGQSGGGAFPALCTHRHAWPLYSLATSLVGVEFTRDGATIRPAGLPAELGAFSFTSRLANVSRSVTGTFTGTLWPLQASASCVVTLEIPHNELGVEQLADLRTRVPAARAEAAEAWVDGFVEEVDVGKGTARPATRVVLRGGLTQCGGELGALQWRF